MPSLLSKVSFSCTDDSDSRLPIGECHHQHSLRAGTSDQNLSLLGRRMFQIGENCGAFILERARCFFKRDACFSRLMTAFIGSHSKIILQERANSAIVHVDTVAVSRLQHRRRVTVPIRVRGRATRRGGWVTIFNSHTIPGPSRAREGRKNRYGSQSCSRAGGGINNKNYSPSDCSSECSSGLASRGIPASLPLGNPWP